MGCVDDVGSLEAVCSDTASSDSAGGGGCGAGIGPISTSSTAGGCGTYNKWKDVWYVQGAKSSPFSFPPPQQYDSVFHTLPSYSNTPSPSPCSSTHVSSPVTLFNTPLPLCSSLLMSLAHLIAPCALQSFFCFFPQFSSIQLLRWGSADDLPRKSRHS